jgi:hypothetical protein
VEALSQFVNAGQYDASSIGPLATEVFDRLTSLLPEGLGTSDSSEAFGVPNFVERLADGFQQGLRLSADEARGLAEQVADGIQGAIDENKLNADSSAERADSSSGAPMDDKVVGTDDHSRTPVFSASNWWDEIGDIRKWIEEKIQNTLNNWKKSAELWGYDNEGNRVHLGWYTDLTPTEAFAVGRGIGTQQEIFDLNRLMKENPQCSDPDLWKKVKGTARVLDLQTGEVGIAETHWYEYGTMKDAQMFELKFKKWIIPPGSI